MNWRTDQENELEQGLLSGTRRTHQKPRLSESVQSAAKRFALIFLLAASCAIFFYTLAASLPPPIKYITPNLGFRIDGIPLNWAQYSPYSPIEPYRSPPLECIVTQVNIVSNQTLYVGHFISIEASSGFLATTTWSKISHLGRFCEHPRSAHETPLRRELYRSPTRFLEVLLL